jgi:CheY-like chemotaxis protein
MHLAPALRSPLSPPRGRVLFVCDRADVDPAVAGVAAELGYEVLRVRNADEALEHAAPPGFALILAGFTGDVQAFAGVVRRLRAAFPPTPLVAIGLPPQRDFPVEPLYEAGALATLDEPISPAGVRLVALTGWGGAADRARSKAAGFDAHLTKPATATAIEGALAAVLALPG